MSSFRSAGPSSFSSGGLGAGSLFSSPALSASRSSGAGAALSTASFFVPAPMYGYGYGGGFGFGGGSSLITLLLFGFLAFSLYTAVQGAAAGAGVGSGAAVTLGGDRVSVVRLQVGLLGIARSLQTELDAIAEKADTSTPSGLQYVLTETVLSLLRHPDFCVYAASGNRTVVGPEAAEASFNELSLDERGKFEAETLVNVNARTKKAGSAVVGTNEAGMTNEYIVVTILVAADAPLKLPAIATAADLRTALTRLGAVGADALQAVEVLWTPQEEGDTLTAAEVARNYPLLVSV